MQKKIIAMLLSLVLVFALTGCFGTKDSTTDGTGTESESSQTTGIAKDDIKVGVIHIGDPADGSGYSYTHDLGIQGMQQAIGLSDDQIIRKTNVSDNDSSAIKTAIESCIAEGCNIIFGTSYGYMDVMNELAGEHPDVYFSHGTGYLSNDTNFNNYFGRIYQARYLAGIAAGLQTKSNKIGYVAAYGTELAETSSGINAFALGAQSVNPDVEVYVKTLQSWYDPTHEKEFAEALIAMGCDVIAQHCDTANPQIAAEENGVYGVGYNSDMSKDAPDAVLTSVVWHWDVYYTAAVNAVINGQWKEFGNYYEGINVGLVGISDLASFADPAASGYISEVTEMMKNGTWDVFSGKTLTCADGKVTTTDTGITDNTGNTVIDKDGKCYVYDKEELKAADSTDAVICGSMNYFVKGVTLK